MRCGGGEQPEKADIQAHTRCDVRKRIDGSVAWPLVLQQPNTPRADGLGVRARATISLCASVPSVFECVGEVYYMVLVCDFFPP